jgi:tol-pal system protein YbgF
LRTQWILLALAAVFFGALGGSMLAPQPAGAVSKEIIELQQQVSQLLQGQQDLRGDLDSNAATLKTLIQQSTDNVNHLNGQMETLQKAVEEVQANTGSSISSMTQQTQGLSDNLQDVQARVGKLSQQMTDIQNLLQSMDARISGGAPAATSSNTNPGSAPSAENPETPGGVPAMAPTSADVLYKNALRDYNSGNYTLAGQEFSDYLKNFPQNDLASNAQFYLGEIYYAQNEFKSAIAAYDKVLANYPKSFKQGASLLKKGMAELELGLKASGTRDLREVVRRFPETDEARRAEEQLHQIGASTTPRSTTH